MFDIEEIRINIILRNDGIRMVIMQPFLELCEHEPFCWQNDKKTKQIERIIRTLEIAKQSDHGCDKTHFTVFPEYAIPGIEGVQKIQEFIRDDSWSNGTIVIGGVDGLTKNEYSLLCNQNNTNVHQENNVDMVPNDQWVNCCITWVKESDGTLKQWVQPKLSPSWPEINVMCSRMFLGKIVYLFSGKFENQMDCQFLSLICFDWIGSIGADYGIWKVLSKINDRWSSSRRNMNLIFVLQFNPKPNHYNFLDNARDYFERRTAYPFVNRDEGIIIFANTAGGLLPGKYDKYGYSSYVASPIAPYDSKGCPPTFALSTQKLRGTDRLSGCKEAVFREMGACLHSFKFRFPPFINLGIADRCLPIEDAIVHAIDDGITDPRIPGRLVPAAIKWTNDLLDIIPPLLENEQLHPLKNNIAIAHRELSKEIGEQSGDFLGRYIEMVSSQIKEKEEKNKWIEIGGRQIPNIDNWDEKEIQSLRTVMHSLSILKTYKPLEVKGAMYHATMKISDKVVDIIIVYGKTHETCFKYAENQYLGSGQRHVIVVTRHISDIPWDKKFDSILEDMGTHYEKDPNITDPYIFRCGYQNLISCVNSHDLSEFNNRIKEVIGL